MKRNLLIILLFLFLFVSFATLYRNPLQNDDASLYALTAKNAIVHNQWLAQFVTPGDETSFLDKPVLGIWLLAWIPKIVGLNELTIHIPNVLYYCLFLLALYFGLARLASKRIALYSTLIAATSLCLVVYSRAPKLDVLLTLFVLTAHLSLFAYLRKEKPAYIYLFVLSLAAGFLVKTGFGLILPGLTVIFLMLFNRPARHKLFHILVTRHSLLVTAMFLFLVGGTLYAQSFALKGQWLPYLISITIQSKYNTSYLGFGFYYSIIGFLLITIFPWTPLALTALKFPFPLPLGEGGKPTRWRVREKLNLGSFASHWFWSNFLFLLFFYKQTDLRTFVVFVPPLAILAAIKLIYLHRKPATKCRGFLLPLLWNLFFLLLFSVVLIVLIIKPYNSDGINISAAIFPIALFTLSLSLLAVFYLRPSPTLWALCFAFIAFAYSVLFYNTKPLVESFNPDIKWPTIVKAQRAEGRKFFIYRPPDRQLFYSPDLFYVDFISGPANRYFWDKKELTKILRHEKAVVLSDTKSWNKTGLKGKIIAQDNYSQIILNQR